MDRRWNALPLTRWFGDGAAAPRRDGWLRRGEGAAPPAIKRVRDNALHLGSDKHWMKKSLSKQKLEIRQVGRRGELWVRMRIFEQRNGPAQFFDRSSVIGDPLPARGDAGIGAND